MPLLITKRSATLPNAKTEERFASRTNRTVTKDDIIAKMASYRSLLGVPEIHACMMLYERAITEFLCDGARVELPFVDLYFSAKGSLKFSK
ncbi:MAG: DNA-binding domain-containing protein [Treponemataceae bacterium]